MLFVCWSCVTAEPQNPEEIVFTQEELALKSQARSLKISRPFLWSVSKDGKTSHLFGTIHSGVDAESELPYSVFQRMHEAESFVMESDAESGLKTLLRPAKNAKNRKYDLKKELNTEAWERLKRTLPLEDNVLSNLPPMMAAILYSSVYTMDVDEQKNVSMDQVMMQDAKTRKKSVYFLETISDLEDLFEQDVALEQLEEMLSENPAEMVHEARTTTYKLIIAYKSGDMEKAEELITGEANEDMVTKVLIDDRNKIWLDRLQPRLAKGNAFIAVGLGHMTGPNSLIKLLQSRGYKLERI